MEHTGPPVGCIHGLLPGLGTSSTPFAKVPGFGLDVEPSTITAFRVLTAFAILSRRAEARVSGSLAVTVQVNLDVF